MGTVTTLRGGGESCYPGPEECRESSRALADSDDIPECWRILCA